MGNSNVYSSGFYQDRENSVRLCIGTQLDDMEKEINELRSPCLVRLMNIPNLTLGDLYTVSPPIRQKVVAAILYNDAFWRLQAAYLILTLGILPIAYSNLRSCLESIIKAHIAENVDIEAKNFIKKGTIDSKKISNFIPKEDNKNILRMKTTFSEWGTHSNLHAVHLCSRFGPNIFDMMAARTNARQNQRLDNDFIIAAKDCVKAVGSVLLIFRWIISKGTTYRRLKS